MPVKSRSSRLAAGLAAGLVTVALAAPAGAGGPRTEHWEGTWDTVHQFGTPRLILAQKGDEVKGVYKDNGKVLGDIWGTLSGKRKRVWSGRFRDRGKSSKGKFTVRLNSDDVSFEGTFKTCGRVFCSDPFGWTGEKR